MSGAGYWNVSANQNHRLSLGSLSLWLLHLHQQVTTGHSSAGGLQPAPLTGSHRVFGEGLDYVVGALEDKRFPKCKTDSSLHVLECLQWAPVPHGSSITKAELSNPR